jgi:hypothetical protein
MDCLKNEHVGWLKSTNGCHGTMVELSAKNLSPKLIKRAHAAIRRTVARVFPLTGLIGGEGVGAGHLTWGQGGGGPAEAAAILGARTSSPASVRGAAGGPATYAARGAGGSRAASSPRLPREAGIVLLDAGRQARCLGSCSSSSSSSSSR